MTPDEKVKPKDDGVTRDASGCVESTQSNYERRGLWGPREVEKVKPIEYEHRTLEEELHDIVHDLATGSGLICPSCGKTL